MARTRWFRGVSSGRFVENCRRKRRVSTILILWSTVCGERRTRTKARFTKYPGNFRVSNKLRGTGGAARKRCERRRDSFYFRAPRFLKLRLRSFSAREAATAVKRETRRGDVLVPRDRIFVVSSVPDKRLSFLQFSRRKAENHGEKPRNRVPAKQVPSNREFLFPTDDISIDVYIAFPFRLSFATLFALQFESRRYFSKSVSNRMDFHADETQRNETKRRKYVCSTSISEYYLK